MTIPKDNQQRSKERLGKLAPVVVGMLLASKQVRDLAKVRLPPDAFDGETNALIKGLLNNDGRLIPTWLGKLGVAIEQGAKVPEAIFQEVFTTILHTRARVAYDQLGFKLGLGSQWDPQEFADGLRALANEVDPKGGK